MTGIRAAGLADRVRLVGHCDDMPAAYMLADVVVATGGSRQGFSRTLVEAQAMGRPVVAEDGGGAAEAVRPGVTGWLAPAGDAAALAEAFVAFDRRLPGFIDQANAMARAIHDALDGWRDDPAVALVIIDAEGDLDAVSARVWAAVEARLL